LLRRSQPPAPPCPDPRRAIPRRCAPAQHRIDLTERFLNLRRTEQLHSRIHLQPFPIDGSAVILTLEKLGGQATLADHYIEVMKVNECKWETKTPFASIRRIVQTRPEIFKVRPGLWELRSYQDMLGLKEYSMKGEMSVESNKQSHAYFQGMLLTIGNLRGYKTYVPNQDKNRFFVNKHLTRMIIVADEKRRPEYDEKVRRSALKEITDRIKFLSYNTLVRQYEEEIFKSSVEFII
jgi:hypothetical protein